MVLIFSDLQIKPPEKSSLTRSSTYDDEDDVSGELLSQNIPQLQTNYQLSQNQLKSQQACLEEFENLQREVEDLHSIFQKFGGQVEEQKEFVDHIEKDVVETAENVAQGEGHLRQALKYQKTMYPICGALLGTCIGGPVGLFIGMKAGGLAALGCGILGFTGGTALKKHEDKVISPDSENGETQTNLKED